MSKEFPESRICEDRGCDCIFHARWNDICAMCDDWSGNCETPDFKCSICSNSYHKDCLDEDDRDPHRFRVCKDLGENFECHQGETQRFEWGKKQSINMSKFRWLQKLKKEYGKDWSLNNADIFYESFMWNNTNYEIDNFVEIIDGEDTGIGKIVNIYLDKGKRAQMVVEWHWRGNDRDTLKQLYPNNFEYLLFEESMGWYLDHDVGIHRIKGKIYIAGSIQESIRKRNVFKKKQKRIKRKLKESECVDGCKKGGNFIDAYYLTKESFNSETNTVHLIDFSSLNIKKEPSEDDDDSMSFEDNTNCSENDEKLNDYDDKVKDEDHNCYGYDDDILSIDNSKNIDNPYSDLTSSSDESQESIEMKNFIKINKKKKDEIPSDNDSDNDEEEYQFVEKEKINPIKSQKEKPIIGKSWHEFMRNENPSTDDQQSEDEQNEMEESEEEEEETEESEDEYHFVEAMNIDIGSQYETKSNDKPLKSALKTKGFGNNLNKLTKKVSFQQDHIAHHRRKIKKLDQEIDELKKIQILKKNEEIESKERMEEWSEIEEILTEMVEIAKKAQDENTKNETKMSQQSDDNQENVTYLIGRVPISVLLAKVLARQNNKQ